MNLEIVSRTASLGIGYPATGKGYNIPPRTAKCYGSGSRRGLYACTDVVFRKKDMIANTLQSAAPKGGGGWGITIKECLSTLSRSAVVRDYAR